MKSNISIFIMTYNEEINIGKCIESVNWSDDIVVLDSYSTDHTIDILSNYTNISVYQREFDDYSSQRNYGINEIDFKNDWILILDADEICSLALKESIFNNVITNLSNDIFCIRRRTFFKNKWVKHNTSYNAWIERIVRPGKVKFYGTVHEKIKFGGNRIKLYGDIYHYPFSKGINDWVDRRIKYAMLEAEINNTNKLSLAMLFDKNPINRRIALKKLYYSLPLC